MFPDGPASERAREPPRILCIRRRAYQIDRDLFTTAGLRRAQPVDREQWYHEGPISVCRYGGVGTVSAHAWTWRFPASPEGHGPQGPVPLPLPLLPAQVVVVAAIVVDDDGMVVVLPARVVVVDWTVDVVAPTEVEVVAREVVGVVGVVVGTPGAEDVPGDDGLVSPVVEDPAVPGGEVVVGDGNWGRNPEPIEPLSKLRTKG